MPKFFEVRENIRSNKVVIKGDNFNHLSKVLRSKIGDEIIVTDEFGFDYMCTINGIFSEHITARIEDFTKNENEPSVKIHLFQSVPKYDKMETIIQKCVEIGAYKIYPVLSARCIAKFDEERGMKKNVRWQKVSESSAKQCGRGIIPEVSNIITFENAVKIATQMDLAFIPFVGEKTNKLKNLPYKNKDNIAFFIGPEGGFDDEEIELCVKNQIIPVTLGKRVLRTETAGINVLSILLFMIENF